MKLRFKNFLSLKAFDESADSKVAGKVYADSPILTLCIPLSFSRFSMAIGSIHLMGYLGTTTIMEVSRSREKNRNKYGRGDYFLVCPNASRNTNDSGILR